MKWLMTMPVAVLVLGAAAPAPAAGDGVRVTVTVINLRNAEGVVRACMTLEEKTFPRCRGVDGAYAARVDASEGTVNLVFEDVPPGRYAIALLHDENDNGKADRALGMMPKEGFGFSRDAPVRMGPPKFRDAVFDLGRQDRTMTIKMRYLL